MSESSNIRRVGSAEVMSKTGDDLWVRIRLSSAPNVNWLQYFRNPIDCQHNKTHPSNARFASDSTLDFESTMGGLKKDIKLMDAYLEQANVACIAQKNKELAEIKRKEELEAEEKEELRKINESIEGL
jgi:hypothetical protein